MNRREFLITAASLTGAAAVQTTLAGTAIASGAQTPKPGPREWTPAEFHAARRFAELGVGKIAYVESGKGPAAIFLHGYPLNGYQWRGAFARLANERRCIAPDLMGLGYSDVNPDADLSPVAQSQMVVAFMDKLGIQEADFVSNDSATGIAQLLAANHPARVRSLLLTNGDVSTNSPPALLGPTLEMARRGELVNWFEKHLNDLEFAHSGASLGRAFSHPETSLRREMLEVYLRPLVTTEKRRKQGQTYATAMLPNPLPAIEPKLRAFDKPVRIVWARNVDLFPEEWAHWLDHTFPKSQGIRFVDGATLFFPEERPELIAEEAQKLWRT